MLTNFTQKKCKVSLHSNLGIYIVQNISLWPALDSLDSLPQQLTFERGVWGKVHGARSDYRWIAVSPSFTGREEELERSLRVGSEDAPATLFSWLTVADTHYAVQFYPSRAEDADGRSGFLEKQIIQWHRHVNMPALLGSLLLLPEVAQYSDESWWNEAKNVSWLENDAFISLDDTTNSVQVSWQQIEQTIEQGCQSLANSFSEEMLSDFYAQLLANPQLTVLDNIEHPLKEAALAALLLPLPRSIADKISIIGWLPTKRPDIEQLSLNWNVILNGTATQLSKAVSPTAEHYRQAQQMSQAILANDPKLLQNIYETADIPVPSNPQISYSDVQITLWGPSAAGKTIFLAQLYVEAVIVKKTDWRIYLNNESLAFTEDMRHKMHDQNVFPLFTTVGDVNKIVYDFKNNKTNNEFSLVIEDRAGADYERFEESAQERLRTANGLILLFDPLRKSKLAREVWDTLAKLQVASGIKTKDARPIAICISKADLLIQSIEDYRRAKNNPDKFVRSFLLKESPKILNLLDNYCSNYNFFPVSSAGVHINHGSIEPMVFYDENLTPRICSVEAPFNLLAPITWLNEQLTMTK